MTAGRRGWVSMPPQSGRTEARRGPPPRPSTPRSIGGVLTGLGEGQGGELPDLRREGGDRRRHAAVAAVFAECLARLLAASVPRGRSK